MEEEGQIVQREGCDLVHRPDFSPRPFASLCHVPPNDGAGGSLGVVGGERVFGGVSPPCSF